MEDNLSHWIALMAGQRKGTEEKTPVEKRMENY